MMWKMLVPGKLQFVRAAGACLLLLALVVGPSCMGLCGGSGCVAPARNSHKEASCHGMSTGGAMRFTAKLNGVNCGTAEVSIAVSGKPSFSVKSGPAASHENTSAGMNAAVAGLFAVSVRRLFVPGGPPVGFPSTNSKTAVLRI